MIESSDTLKILLNKEQEILLICLSRTVFEVVLKIVVSSSSIESIVLLHDHDHVLEELITIIMLKRK